jgi:hypothetical protein
MSKELKNETIDKEFVIKKFRKKLKSDGRSLVWWHRTYVPELLTYAYFIRQLMLNESMCDDLFEAIQIYENG